LSVERLLEEAKAALKSQVTWLAFSPIHEQCEVPAKKVNVNLKSDATWLAFFLERCNVLA